MLDLEKAKERLRVILKYSTPNSLVYLNASNAINFLTETDEEKLIRLNKEKATISTVIPNKPKKKKRPHVPGEVYCKICNKYFSEQKGYDNHLTGKKHKFHTERWEAKQAKMALAEQNKQDSMPKLIDEPITDGHHSIDPKGNVIPPRI